jgi:methionyl-tRNA synthetase
MCYALEQEIRIMINIDDFAKVEIRVGKILSAEKVPETDKLLKLTIALYFPDPQALVGVKCPFVTNLELRMIKGLESNGMIMAVSTPNNEDGTPGVFSLLRVSEDIPEGTKVK